MEQIQRREQKPQFSHRDYTMQLMQFASDTGRIGDVRAKAMVQMIAQEAQKRARDYTAGRSTTVSRKQAEAFYASVFFQLDAALLSMDNDEMALDALCTLPLSVLMEAGEQKIHALYAEAKEDFRAAYKLTEPVQTSFFHDLLQGFAQFITTYDARFHAKDAREYVEFCYPLLSGRMPDEDGLIAVHAYYRALRREGEFLSRFAPDAVYGLMTRYAARFRTSPDMIAENIAELVLRQWLTGVLSGQPDAESLSLPESAAETVTAQYAGRSQQDLSNAVMQAIRTQPLTAEPADMQAYLLQNVPAVADAMYAHIAGNTLAGWVTAG